jgi:hypothetical protein
MMIALLPFLVLLVGLLMYALCDGKLVEIGRIMFFVGLLVLVWTMAGKTLHIG